MRCQVFPINIIGAADPGHFSKQNALINSISKARIMLGELSASEIEILLSEQFVGRIGCASEDMVYVVPTGYAYDGEFIYCHANEGRKIDIMRRNPKVCFQVDDTKDMTNWKSVIVWGEFEELSDEQQRNVGLQILLERRLPVPSSILTHLGDTWPFSAVNGNVVEEIPGIVFRIQLTEKSGKFETTSNSSFLMYN